MKTLAFLALALILVLSLLPAALAQSDASPNPQAEQFAQPDTPASDGISWRTGVLDQSGGGSSIVADAQRRPHVSYSRSGLRYAVLGAGGWTRETVPGTTPVWKTSLVRPNASPAAATSLASTGSMLLIENAGQWPAAARFQVWGSPLGAGATWLAEDAIWFVVAADKLQVADLEASADRLTDLQPANLHSTPFRDFVQPATLTAIKLTFPGSNPDVRIEPFEALTTTVSYFINGGPEQWRPAVPAWGRVRYVDLYAGVDLVLGGRAGGWQLDAAPGAAVDQVRVQVEGADVVAVNGSTLQLAAADDFVFVVLPAAPFAYQAAACPDKVTPDGHRAWRSTPCKSARPTTTPPICSTTPSWGAFSATPRHAVTVDRSGSAYLTGDTLSNNFPTTPGTVDPTFNGGNCGPYPCSDAFVIKMNPTGSRLTYATFLGGGYFEDYGNAIAVGRPPATPTLRVQPNPPTSLLRQAPSTRSSVAAAMRSQSR